MNFILLKPAEFTKFANNSPYKSFLQTTEIASLREKKGWTSYYFGVEENEKIIAAAMAVAKPTFLGKSIFSVPGGPLMDYENKELVNFFFKNLKNYTKSHNGYLLHIEPYYELIERDKNGEIEKTGFNHKRTQKYLKEIGFLEVEPENPKYHFALNLKNLNEEELFSSFKQNTRNLINRTAKKDVKVRELKREELTTFKNITESTSERRHFSDKTLDYYETMYDLFSKKNQVKFIVAEIPGQKPNKKTPIAAAMFMTYGDEVIYLFSGSDEKYMKEYNAQYAIQWYMIKYAINNKFQTYNFYGIQGLPDPQKPGYGIYRFKKGFGAKYGKVVELIGAYELPVNLFFYNLHQLLSKFKNIKKGKHVQ